MLESNPGVAMKPCVVSLLLAACMPIGGLQPSEPLAVDSSATGVAPDSEPDPDGDDSDATVDSGDSGEAINRDPFTVIALPDTQVYAASYPEIFTAQTQWAVDAREARDIAAVLHEGDMTDDNTDDDQWEVAEQSMGLLDDWLPYAFSLGNHDMGSGGDGEDRSTQVNDYFPPTRFEHQDWYGGNLNDSSSNSYIFFEAAGVEFLVLALEFGPTDGTLAWASSVIEANPLRRVILLTHCYMHDNDVRVTGNTSFNPHNYGIDAPDVNDGEEIWQDFASQHEQIFMVLSGHVTGDGASRLTSEGLHGNLVHQMLANYQAQERGGSGYLRILTFLPEEDRIEVSTYSPLIAETDGEEAAYRDDEQNSFSLDYDMSLD